MAVLKKTGGVILILFSLLILLMFVVSFYNIIFKGGKFVFSMSNIIIIPIFIAIMIYLFIWGLKLLKGEEVQSPKIKI